MVVSKIGKYGSNNWLVKKVRLPVVKIKVMAMLSLCLPLNLYSIKKQGNPLYPKIPNSVKTKKLLLLQNLFVARAASHNKKVLNLLI